MATKRFASTRDLRKVLLEDGSGTAIDIKKGTLVLAETSLAEMASPFERTFEILSEQHVGKKCKMPSYTFIYAFDRVYSEA